MIFAWRWSRKFDLTTIFSVYVFLEDSIEMINLLLVISPSSCRLADRQFEAIWDKQENRE